MFVGRWLGSKGNLFERIISSQALAIINSHIGRTDEHSESRCMDIKFDV